MLTNAILYYTLLQCEVKPEQFMMVEGQYNGPHPRYLEVTTYEDAMNKVVGMCNLKDTHAEVQVVYAYKPFPLTKIVDRYTYVDYKM